MFLKISAKIINIQQKPRRAIMIDMLALITLVKLSISLVAVSAGKID